MAVVYPVILSKEANGYFVTIPDFDANTEGEGEQLPKPFSRTCEKELGDQEALIDIDFEDYRKKHDNRTVKKNCTIPYYLNAQAEKAGINFSRLLQDALKRELSC